MGLTAKPVGKFQSIMKKMENQLEAERLLKRRRRRRKRSKDERSKQII